MLALAVSPDKTSTTEARKKKPDRKRDARSDPAIVVDKTRYEADLALLDRYQAFSAELARLSMLGIVSLSYFSDKLAAKPHEPRLCAWAALMCFGMSVAGALGHRYLSSDGLFYHLHAARLHVGPGDSDDSQNQETRRTLCKEEAHLRNARYNWAGTYLGFSAATCGLGALALAGAFAYLLGGPDDVVGGGGLKP